MEERYACPNEHSTSRTILKARAVVLSKLSRVQHNSLTSRPPKILVARLVYSL